MDLAHFLAKLTTVAPLQFLRPAVAPLPFDATRVAELLTLRLRHRSENENRNHRSLRRPRKIEPSSENVSLRSQCVEERQRGQHRSENAG